MGEIRKRAFTIDEQINLLRSRGMIISDEKQTKKMLLSVGYYHLGAYWFYFEVSQDVYKRNHTFRKNTRWQMVEALYNFDISLQDILSSYLHTIETDIKTKMIYYISNVYTNNPFWYADTTVVNTSFIKTLQSIYTNTVLNNDVIKRHHKCHPNDLFAPAWKTLDFFRFGDLMLLYNNLKDQVVQLLISQLYGINSRKLFTSFFDTLRFVRNICAHRNILYDMHLYHPIKTSTLVSLSTKDCSNIAGVLKVIYYMLGKIDAVKVLTLRTKIQSLVEAPEYRSIHFLLQDIVY